jgi:hypothetical protein
MAPACWFRCRAETDLPLILYGLREASRKKSLRSPDALAPARRGMRRMRYPEIVFG